MNPDRSFLAAAAFVLTTACAHTPKATEVDPSAQPLRDRIIAMTDAEESAEVFGTANVAWSRVEELLQGSGCEPVKIESEQRDGTFMYIVDCATPEEQAEIEGLRNKRRENALHEAAVGLDQEPCK